MASDAATSVKCEVNIVKTAHGIFFSPDSSIRHFFVPAFVCHGRWILLRCHWEPGHAEVHKVSVSEVKPEEDHKVSKPVNCRGKHANILHKLLWQQSMMQLAKWRAEITKGCSSFYVLCVFLCWSAKLLLLWADMNSICGFDLLQTQRRSTGRC